MKKILIASLFATIMLLVPFSSSTGASIGELNIKGEVIGETYPVIPDYLLEELYDLINQLLLYYGHLPEIVAICNEILEIINSDDPYPVFCASLGIMLVSIGVWIFIFDGLAFYWKDKDPNMYQFFFTLSVIVQEMILLLFVIGIFVCGWDLPPPPGKLEIETGFNLQATQNSINELIQSNEVNMCPCGQ